MAINSDWLRAYSEGRDARRAAGFPASSPEKTGKAVDEQAIDKSERMVSRDSALPTAAPRSSSPAGAPAGSPGNQKPTNEDKKQQQGDGVNMEALRQEIVVREIEDIKFSDIKGQDKAVAQIQQVADKLRYGQIFRFVGAEMPRGMLLYGPPGTGKTMMGTALANSAQAAFLNVSCAEVLSKYVGESEQKIDAIFDIAEQEAANHPNGHAILFMDEVEALLRSRDLDSHESSEKVLSIVLQRMNGLKKGGKVTIVACTNRPDKLDSAFVSRLNAVIEVPLPDADGRSAIFKARLNKCEKRANEAFPDRDISFLGDIDHDGIAELLVDQSGNKCISGRELDNLANEVVSRRAADILVQYKKWEESQQIVHADSGKIEVNLDRVASIAAELGPVTTREVIEAAMEFSKTGFLFDKSKDADHYLQQIQERKQQEKASQGTDQTPEPTVQYDLTGGSREQARNELIDTLVARIKSREETGDQLLRDLYVENESMPDKVRGIVSTLLSHSLQQDEAIKMLEALRNDEELEPPHIPTLSSNSGN